MSCFRLRYSNYFSCHMYRSWGPNKDLLRVDKWEATNTDPILDPNSKTPKPKKGINLLNYKKTKLNYLKKRLLILSANLNKVDKSNRGMQENKMIEPPSLSENINDNADMLEQ